MTSTRDIKRVQLPNVKLHDLRDGQTVYLDAGFTCHHAGPVKVHGNGADAYFMCTEGRHMFDGQAELNEDEDDFSCIGVYANDPVQRK